MPQELIIESDEAYELAHRLAEELGMTVDEVVEEALRLYAERLYALDGMQQGERRPPPAQFEQS